MNKAQRARLEAAGFEFVDVQELLGLTDAEAALVEIKVALAQEIIVRRKAKRLSQKKLAAVIGSSQSRVSAMESGDATIDQLARTLITLGVDRKEIGRLVAA